MYHSARYELITLDLYIVTEILIFFLVFSVKSQFLHVHCMKSDDSPHLTRETPMPQQTRRISTLLTSVVTPVFSSIITSSWPYLFMDITIPSDNIKITFSILRVWAIWDGDLKMVVPLILLGIYSPLVIIVCTCLQCIQDS